MSHAAIDEASYLRRLIITADGDLAAAKSEPVVDIRALAELKRRRETLVAELEMAETKAR